MAINYQSPEFQNALLRSVAKRPYGGIRSNSALVSKYAADQARQGLALSQVASATKLRDAAIADMAKRADIAAAQTEIAKSRLGLGWGELDIAKSRLGLGERKVGLDERKLGLEESRIGLAGRYSDLAFGQEQWKRDFLDNKLADEERNLWLSTALGLGTTGWSAYEGNRRAKLIEAETEENRAWRKRMEARK